jgi:hypothetical protein
MQVTMVTFTVEIVFAVVGWRGAAAVVAAVTYAVLAICPEGSRF